MRKPRRSRSSVRALVLAALVLLIVATAPAIPAPPVPPMRVDGNAFDAAALPLAAGTRVHATFDGVDYGNGSVVLDGAGGFSLLVEGNSWLGAAPGTSDTPTIKEGPDPDELLVFAAGDFATSADVFEEVLAWQSGVVAAQDLHLPPGPASIVPLKIQGVVARSVVEPNPYVQVCNPTSSAVDLGDYALEVNRPGVVRGPNVSLSGSLAPNDVVQVDLGSASFLTATGDALKLVYDNPGGPNAPASGADVVVDRVEFNATTGGTLTWEPGNTILGDAPAPRAGFILERAATCVDTDDPGDFRLAPEPGLPPNVAPTVTIIAPTAGAVVRVAESLPIAWTMADETFPASDLLVWVNATVGATTASVVSGAMGATSAAWIVPDVPGDITITVEVVDPFGARGSDSVGPLSTRPPDPLGGLFAVILAALVVLVIVGVLLVAYRSRRSRAQAPPRPPPQPPSSAPAAGPPTAGPSPAAAGTKRCPRCGTAVH
ncbi:MAG: hypothetical protein ACT4OI_01385, partial [Methanobacteriota archaeon]